MPIFVVNAGDALVGSSPIVGVAAEADAASRTLVRIADEVDYGSSSAVQAVALMRTLSGRSVTRLQSQIDTGFMRGAARLAIDLSIASSAFAVYADEVNRIHAQARDVLSEVEQLLMRIRGCALELEEAALALRIDPHAHVPSVWRERPAVFPPAPIGAADGEVLNQIAKARAAGDWIAQAMAWGAAADGITDQQSRWSRLILDREECESQLVSRLRSTDLGPLIDFHGSTDRARITRHYTGAAVHRSRYAADPLLQDILSGELPPETVARKWRVLGLSLEEVEGLPIEVLFALGNTDGVPFEVQDIAANAALDYALENPDLAIRMMGLSGEMSVESFVAQLKCIRWAHGDAVMSARSINDTPTVQLFGFGSHDGALTAAISLGDLDTASHVGVNVSGMGSDVTSFSNGLGGAEQLYLEAAGFNRDSQPAVVTWIGYRSPAMPPSIEVTLGDRAAAGARPLADFIDGIDAVRTVSGYPMQGFTVFAHSYGSTTAAEALKLTEVRVDAFVIYGSAGLQQGTTVDQLHADRVYATGAEGDDVAWMGLAGSGRENPVEIYGVEAFGSERNGERVRVTAHDMFTEDKEPSYFNWGGKVGYLTEGTSSVEIMGRILGGGTP